MEKVLISLVLCLSTFLTFGITPVFAEEWEPPYWQIDSIYYFLRSGAQWNVPNNTIEYITTGQSSISERLIISGVSIANSLDGSNLSFSGTSNDGWVTCIPNTTTSSPWYSCAPYADYRGEGSFEFKLDSPISVFGNGSTISGTAIYSLTTTYVDKFNMQLPLLNASSILTSTSFSYGSNSYLYKGKYYITLIGLGGISAAWDNFLVGQDGTIVNPKKWDVNAITGYGNHVTMEYELPKNQHYCFRFKTQNNYNFIPIYAGDGKYLTDEVAMLIGIPSESQKLLSNLVTGNSSSQQIINNSNSVNSAYSSADQQMEALENNVTADFNSRIDNIPTSSNLLSLPKLVASANWVRQRFNEINIEPFSIMLEFSLILGIALIFLGKIR